MKTASSRSIVCAALLGAHLLGACASWQPAQMSPTVLADYHNPDKVRIRQTDGTMFVMHDPRLVLDTLVGKADTTERRVSLASVSQLEIRKVTGGAVAAFAGLLVVGLVLAVVITCKTYESGQSNCS